MKTTQQVQKHLASSVKFRNDDKLLRLKVWEDFGFYLTPEQKRIYRNLPSDGAIARHRRSLRAVYPESEPVMAQRFKLFNKERDQRNNGSWLKRLGWLK